MIGYLGPEGSFTHQALSTYLSKIAKKDSPLKSFQTISQVIDAISSGKVQSGLVPIENSIEGSVGETLDSLIKTSQKVIINHEVVIPVEHCLISKKENLNEIKKVLAHSQALSQCQIFLKRFLPEATLEPTTSNSLAVKMVSESDDSLAAIGPAMASEIYKVPILEKKINDERENFTRFVLIGTETMSPTGNDKTTIAFGVPYDKPGTLVGVLQSFAKEKINLSKIESRPSKKALGEYIFFIDLEAHREDRQLKKALSEIAHELSYYRWLGSYPRWK